MDTANVRIEDEVWKGIPGFVGYYQVSNLGRVKSLTRTSVNKRGITTTYSAKYLRPGTCRNYLYYMLSRLGTQKNYSGHYLVLLAFVGPRVQGYVINHINCIVWDNRLKNLEYVTPSENAKHAYKVSLEQRYDCSYNSNKQRSLKSPALVYALTKEQVIQVRKLRQEGKLFIQIARIVGIDKRNAQQAVTAHYRWVEN